MNLLLVPLEAGISLAEETYKFGFHCITAGKWLRTKIENSGAITEGFFELAVDHSIFFPTVSPSEPEIPKVAVYSRAGTERRLSEMVIHGLNILSTRGVKFEVLFLGRPKFLLRHFSRIQLLGIISPRKLAKLYRTSNIGIVFSGTNYSLVPLEMMACGLPVIEFDGENTRHTYPTDTVEFSSPNPHSIANKVEGLFEDCLRREQLKKESARFVNSLNWEKSVKTIEGLIKIGLSIIVILMKASVIIPTYNGGKILVEVIESLINQQFTEKWEIILIDSESTDGSISKISSLASKNSIKLNVIKVDRPNFSHGATRNEAISQSSGEFIALLTQDSVPTDKYWLRQLINGFDLDEVAGVFGEHKAHKYHPKIIARDLDRHFHLMSQTEYRTSREWFQSKHDLQNQQLLHFFFE